MKARDLAVLAALGIAGKYAYDKFGGKKDDEPKTRGKLGESQSDNDGTAGETENYNNEGRNAKFADEDYSNEGRGRAVERYGAETTRKGIQSGNAEDYDVPRTAAKAAVVKKKDAVEEAAAAPKIRAFTPPGAQDSMGAFTSAGQAGAAAPGTRAFTPPGYVASANAYNQARTTDTPSSAALGDYARAINPAMHADRMLGASHPSARITDKLAVDSRASQAAALAKKRAEQAQMDALRSSGGRRAKGGVVKMASGGMTSSKMSKPSGASRGDGIAQRGKTRGKYL